MSQALAILECHKNLANGHKESLDQAIRRVGSAYATGMDRFQETLREQEREEQRRVLEQQLLLAVLGGCLAGGISWLGVLATETITLRYVVQRYSGFSSQGPYTGVVRMRDLIEESLSRLQQVEEGTRFILQDPARAAQFRSLLAKVKALEDTLAAGGSNLVQVGLLPEAWQADTSPVSLNPQVFQNRLQNRFSHYWSLMLTLFQQAHVEVLSRGDSVDAQRFHSRIAGWVAQFRQLSPQTVAESEMAGGFEKSFWARFILQHFVSANIPRGPILRRLGALGIFQEAGADALWRQYSLAGPLHPVPSEHEKVRQWARRFQPPAFGPEVQSSPAPVPQDLVCPAPPPPPPPRRRATAGRR